MEVWQDKRMRRKKSKKKDLVMEGFLKMVNLWKLSK